MAKKLKYRKPKLEKCPMGDCWEMTPKGKLCSACSSWWYRVNLKTAAELTFYLKKNSRMAGRIGTMMPKFGQRKTK